MAVGACLVPALEQRICETMPPLNMCSAPSKVTCNAVAEAFLAYFAARGFARVRSSSLVIDGDDSTLFASAGMHPFKTELASGVGWTDSNGATHSLVCSIQKCLRMPDLRCVGADFGYQTFFEMAGFFGFHGLELKRAAGLVWSFLTDADGLGIPVSRLGVVTHRDDETSTKIWLEIEPSLEPSLLRAGDGFSFWPKDALVQGPDGPCGYRSRIFYRRDQSEVHLDDARGLSENALDIGDLVVLAYRRTLVDGSPRLRKLEHARVDFGVGLERLVLVATHGNRTTPNTAWPLDMDPVDRLLKRVQEVAAAAARFDPQPGEHDLARYGRVASEPKLVGERRIVDHVRALSFLIADGVRPEARGRGSVLRRLIRSASATSLELGARRPFLHELVGDVCASYGERYPELFESRSCCEEVVANEERRFWLALVRGATKLEELASRPGFTHDTGEAMRFACGTLGLTRAIALQVLRAKGFDCTNWSSESSSVPRPATSEPRRPIFNMPESEEEGVDR